ncbi:ABC transporter ATP-binding protein (plasmid) [Agrobacterium leguminum]|uniref:High-affinity branched-chain amino acid transport protein (ABC superfamily, atp_bind) n=1 Tax=Agrobacterium deltaense NCPPB 1641 TaxID=1183425 RepID=A0A1S7UBT5_9HYPH|nr:MULTISPECIES: ABC transporter ATP-binding protein [Agrobacterium]WFS69737.1 ABC transporter ATP-binding protein [Agrobacterium leguminum]CVI64041.1 high-affinity branched-chain amino acid transport protein (ABC superfamily, atp_bind) [Agrobacterium deltaense NCPPB 1641]
MSASLLSLSHLNVFYGEFQAIFDLELTVREGECIALVGANGAGKSTLLKAMAGLLLPGSGAIRFRDEDVIALGAESIVRKGITLVPEGRRLFPSLTVEENLLMGAEASRRGPWNLQRVYDTFPNIAERRRNLGSALSGGQQQMVAIGRALMTNPEILLCDEISLGLAPVVVRDLYAKLASLRSEGLSMVIVEQDISQAAKAADRLYCLRSGRVVLEGDPQSLSRQEITDAYFGMAGAEHADH